MCPSKSRTFDHMKVDASQVQQVRCVLELEDDETYHSHHRRMCVLPECPAMRLRLLQHLLDCRGRRPPTVDFGTNYSDTLTLKLERKESPKSVVSREVLTDFFGQSIAVSPSISMDDKLIAPSYNKNKKKHTEHIVKDKGCDVHNIITSEHKLKHCETVILHPKGLYKDNLQTIILEWLIEIPIFPNNFEDQASKLAKENAVNELNKAICDLKEDINDELYDANVKRHIHNFLECLPIWLTCSWKEQDIYKAHLKNKLYEEIKKLNKFVFNETHDKETYVRNCTRKIHYSSIEELVINYITNLEFVKTNELGNTIDMQQVETFILDRLRPIIKNKSQIGESKAFIKTELINILRDIPLAWPHYKENNLDKYAEEIANKILELRKHTCSRQHYNDTQVQNLEATVCDDDREINFIKYVTVQNIIQLLSNVVDTNNNDSKKEELVDILLDSFDSILSGNESDAKSAIFECLNISYGVIGQSSSFLANTIVGKIKNVTQTHFPIADKSCSPIFMNKDISHNVVLVSDRDLSGQGPSSFPMTSTPKKSIPKLNAEEQQYTDDLSKLISAWIDTIPELAHVKDNKSYKEAMVSNLAGHLTDEIKLEQYTPDKRYYITRDNMITCAIRSWLIKFEENAFKNIKEIKPYVDTFIKQFGEIPVPELTRSQHGSRRDMKATIFRGDFSDEDIDFKADDLDIIEDGISIWMNEQPSRIYANEDRDMRNKKIHDFAMKIQSQLKNKRPSPEISLETKLWLDKMLKPNEKKNLDNLSENLKNRILKIPLGGTFNADLESKEVLSKSADKPVVAHDIPCLDLNKTLKDFIDKYIENNCEEDDAIVKGAFTEILKSEFRRYSPQAKLELYSKCGTECKSKDNFPQKLTRELYYIREISDWLKNIPIDNSFNVAGNKKRIDFVINLSKDICEVEIEKMQTPNAMDYEQYLAHIIARNYVRRLPISSSGMDNQAQIVLKLIKRIIKSRVDLNQPNKTMDDSLEMEEQNINEFIDEYIRINGIEIADDPAKLEVWNARLIKEINKMAQESEPTSSFKMKAYDRLANIPIPGDDSVIEFNRKLMYAHEIGDWIKNMPLQPISEQETAVTLVRMISDLAEKLAENQSINIKNDSELTEHVTKWILALPLESEKAVNTTVLIQQLSKRIERVNEGKNQSLNESSYVQNKSIKNTSKINKNNSRQSIFKIKKTNSVSGNSKIGCSGELVVDAIESWCNNLPINENNKDDESAIKDNIVLRLYQKVGDLNLDPRFNDDILYKDQLNDEIEETFKDLQQYNDLVKKKESLKTSLINSIVEARGIVKERTAGSQYRHKLENTIEASIPSPVTNSKIYDPGFELYKTKLANMFILENFDHGDDPVKLKYEVKIKDEIDKYFSEAQKRNAVPLSRDEIYNELYSALFKVPIPNERSVIQEVEEVKLRCEIDGWFEGLPIREAVNLNELLDWDQILAMLAKRIYEIESNGPKPEDKIHDEVKKWLVKFPLLSGQEKNIDKHAKALIDRLKASKDERKCTPKSQLDKVSKKGKNLKKTAKRESMIKNISQAPGSSANAFLRISPMGRASQVSSISPAPCCVTASTPIRKPADIMLGIVENWCQSLPLFPELGETEGTIKDDLMTKILRKVSELNANPEIFDDDFLYDDYLDDELDRLFKTLPICCELQKNTEFKKFELISALKLIKPLIRAERARHEYKKEIRSTVRNMLKGPLDTTPEKGLFEDLVDEIADSFVQYNYNKDDHEQKQVYKNKVRNAVIKYYSELDDKADEDTLIKQNKILCELAKIPVPGEEAIKEDVEQIKMKEEVSKFLEEVIPNADADQKKLIKTNLSKRLHDIEKSGHSCANDKTIQEEISTSFRTLKTDVSMDKIESFVKTLRNTEAERKSSPARRSDEPFASMNVSQQLQQHGWKYGQISDSSAESNYEYQPSSPKHYPTFPSPPGDSMSYQSESIKYHTLLPEVVASRPAPGIQGRPTTQWYQPAGSLRSARSQEWHTLPPQSPSQRLLPEMASKAPPAWHTLPSPGPEHRPPPEMMQSFLSRQISARAPSIRQMTPERSLPFESFPGIPSPGRDLEDRFLPRPQSRRQSLEIPPSQSAYHTPRRTSLQAPLRYDYEVHDNRNVPMSYREVCLESPRNATVPHYSADPAEAFSPQAASHISLAVTPPGTRHPQSPISIPAVYTEPSQVLLHRPQNVPLQSQIPAVEPTMSSRPLQSYQGFQNAVDAVSSPAPVPGLNLNIPISAVPQSTRNTAAIREDAAPAVSNIPHETPEDVSPPEGTHRLAGAPDLISPRRRRRRVIPNGEEGEEICDCFHQSGRKRRCMPLPEDWGSFPFWCYMPVPLCYF